MILILMLLSKMFDCQIKPVKNFEFEWNIEDEP